MADPTDNDPTFTLPEQYIFATPTPEPEEAPAAAPAAAAEYGPEIPDDEIEPPIVRHDPYADTRSHPWMDPALDAIGRVMVLVRRDLADFPVLEGRDPRGADIDAMVDKHVGFLRPILQREEAIKVAYDELDNQRAERIAKKRAATAVAAPLGTAIARAAPVAGGLGAAAAGIAAAAGSLVALKLVHDAEIEKKKQRLFGPTNRSPAKVDPVKELDGAIARAPKFEEDGSGPGDPNQRDRPPSIVVLVSEDGKEPIRKRIRTDELEKVCRAYPVVQWAANEAGKAIEGIPPGPRRGRIAHSVMEAILKQWARDVENSLRRRGIEKFYLEKAFRKGERLKYVKRGSSKIDVVEILEGKVACIYDLKTGGAVFSKEQQDRYRKELEDYFEKRGYRVFVFEVRPENPRLR